MQYYFLRDSKNSNSKFYLMKKLLNFVVLCFVSGCSSKAPTLGVLNGLLKECPDSPNCVCSQSKSKDHFIAPVKLEASLVEAKETLLKVITDSERAETIVEEENYIRAEFSSKLIGFVDDVEFYLTNGEGMTTLVHVRSASRTGHSDFGVNRERIESIRQKVSLLAS